MLRFSIPFRSLSLRVVSPLEDSSSFEDSYRLCAADVIVTNFAAEQAAIWIANGAIANFVGTQITQNSISKTLVGGVMCIHGMESLTFYVPKDTIVRLKNVTIVGNTAAYSLLSYTEGSGDYEVYVYSDVVRMVAYLDVNTEFKKTGSILQAPRSQPGIDVTDAWFLRTQEVCESCIYRRYCHRNNDCFWLLLGN